jgi:hypothetical protein
MKRLGGGGFLMPKYDVAFLEDSYSVFLASYTVSSYIPFTCICKQVSQHS